MIEKTHEKNVSTLREFSHHTLLSVLGMLGVSIYILADTIFVAWGLGPDGLTAMNLGLPINSFIRGVGLMIGVGGATKFAVIRAHGTSQRLDRLYFHAVILGVSFSILFILIGVFAADALSKLLGADERLLETTSTYVRGLLLFAPAYIFNDILLCFVRNDEDPRLAMFAMLIGSFSNIVLDYVFVFPLEMGMLGIVLATGLASVLGVLILLLHWRRKENNIHFVLMRWQHKIAAREMQLGLPSLIAQVSSGIVIIVFNLLILHLTGNTGVAAYGVVTNIALIVLYVFNGIALGVQPLISAAHGSGSTPHVHTLMRYALVTTCVVSIGAYALLYFFAQPLAFAFNNEADMQLQAIAVQGIHLYFIGAPFAGYNTILSQFFTSVEKPAPAHILSILRGFVLIIPLAFIMADLWHMVGIWLAYPLSEAICTLLGSVMYKRSQQMGSRHGAVQSPCESA